MKTLNEVADRHPLVKKILSDISIGHTDAAVQINYHFKNNYPGGMVPDHDFTTTEASVRRWRRATMDRLDGSESNAKASAGTYLGHPLGSPLNPAEAVSGPQDFPNILFLDIETTPILAYVWRVWKENISPDMIVQPSEILCFAASWLGEDDVHWYGVKNDKRIMLSALWNMLNKADVVVHYNGKQFDIPRINTEFVTNNILTPPSPYKQVDLLLTARKTFGFSHNKLSAVSTRLGTSRKAENSGMKLWRGCMEGDAKSWDDMMLYNIQDVRVLKEIYDTMRPWITGHPSFAAHSGKLQCPTCGKDNLKRDGYYHTSVSRYPRYVCRNCGTWSRETRRIAGAEVTGIQI